MRTWVRQLDRLLRGETTSLNELRRDTLDFPVLGICAVISILGLIYGACMGLFAVTGSGNNAWMQIPASMLKVPALFFLTLVVTVPSLYVFNALVGSRLTLPSVLRLLIASLAIMLAVLSSLGPIVAFFAVSSTSYSFILLLNVLVYSLSGFLGLAFLLQTLHRITIVHLNTPPASPPLPPATSKDESIALQVEPLDELGALDKVQGKMLGDHVKTIFRIWVIVFAVVGAQMAWVLRPFVGQPGKPFEWFRERGGNFFETVWQLLMGFLGAGGWSSR